MCLKQSNAAKEIALQSLNRGQGRAILVAKRVLSYVCDHPDRVPKKLGTTEFVKRALKDPKHPARQHSTINAQVEKNAEFINEILHVLPVVFEDDSKQS